jgi:thiol peroxidase
MATTAFRLMTVIAVALVALPGGCRNNDNLKGEATMAARERTGIVTMKGGPLTLLGPELKVGDRAPDFTAVDGGFAPVKLSDFAGKTVLISAVPSLDTGVCQIQTKRFNEEAERLPDSVVVLTVSMDLPFAQSRFCGAENIKKIRVLSDSLHRDFGDKFGLRIKENGLLARSVWIVDPKGTITYRQIVPELTTEPDYAAALAAVKK